MRKVTVVYSVIRSTLGIVGIKACPPGCFGELRPRRRVAAS